MSRTVARLLAESLEAHDVDQVYCVPGESYIGLTSALIERNSIRVIVCRHEGGAGYMAVADGRLRDRAGVAMVSRGPGLSNAMVSLHSAYHDATPVVMLVGQVERAPARHRRVKDSRAKDPRAKDSRAKDPASAAVVAGPKPRSMGIALTTGRHGGRGGANRR